MRMMLAEMGTLKAARKERLLHGPMEEPRQSFAQRRAAALVQRDELTSDQWSSLPAEGKYLAIGAVVRRINSEYRSELFRMKQEAIDKARKARRFRLSQGGMGEIQRLLGKRAPVSPQWGLLPRTPTFRYPSVMLLNSEGMVSLKARYGDDVEKGLDKWQAEGGAAWWELRQRERDISVFVRQKGDHTEVSIQPLTEMTALIEDSPLGVEDMYASDSIRPWTTPSDKLSQLEFYYSTQSTATGSGCELCRQQEGREATPPREGAGGQVDRTGCLIPLSKAIDGSREVVWWCRTCRCIQPIRISQDISQHDILEHTAVRPFDTSYRIEGEMDRATLTYYLEKLPRRKAPGTDGLPYELLHDAPMALQDLLFKAMNSLLTGTPVPETWKSGMVRLLTKREPCSELENLRPVTLLQTTYKLFTGIVNDRFQRMMEHSGILEHSQDGFRPHRQTRQPITKLQYCVQETRRDGGKIYVAYLDWFSAFTSVSLHKMYYLMERMGMHPNDIEMIRGAQRGTWTSVATTYGNTARIPTSRGTPQGDTLSPSLFILFINLCLRHLAGAGVGHIHSCGLRRNHACFADDLALIAHSAEDMNLLLQRVHEFALWSNMELCLLKCEITGYDFGLGAELPTNVIKLGGQQLTSLSATSSYKYLGLRLAVTGSTADERQYVLAACRRAATALKGHAYTTQQALDIIEMAVKPVFGYSCPMTQWRRSELEILERAWTSVTKRAWGLTLGHNSAPFRLPGEHGGIAGTPAVTLQAKTVTGLLSQLRNDHDGEVKELLKQEWGWLCKDWGTQNVWGIQLCLMALDDPGEYPNLLSQMLYTMGQNGVTAEVPDLLPTRANSIKHGEIVQALEAYLWSACQEAAVSGKGADQL